MTLKKIPSVGSQVRIQYKDDADLLDQVPFPALESAEGIYCYLENGKPLQHKYFPGEKTIYVTEAPPELSQSYCLFY